MTSINVSEGTSGSDSTKPNITTPSSNTTLANTLVLISAIGSDDTAIDSCWLETNNTGTFANQSAKSAGSVTSYAFNDTLTLNSTSGVTVQAGVWCNDTAGNTNRSALLDIITTSSDSTPPDISYVSPTLANNSYTSNTWVYVNVSVSETPSACLLEWAGTNESMTIAGSGANCYNNKTGLSDGTYTYKVFGNDSSGNMNVSSLQTVIVDTTSSNITFVSPTDLAAAVTRNYTYVNTTTNEACSWSQIDWNGTNQTWDGNSSSNKNFFVNKTGLNNGNYSFTAYCNDSAGNMGSNSSWVFINQTAAAAVNLTILYPTNSTLMLALVKNFINTSLDINHSFSGGTKDVVLCSVDGGANVTATNNVTVTQRLIPGSHNVTCFGNNTAGSSNTTTVYFTIQRKNPFAGGGAASIVGGIISYAVYLMLRRRR